jgi:hypothetical protein
MIGVPPVRRPDLGVTIGLLILVTYHGVTITNLHGAGARGHGMAIFGMQSSVHTGLQILTAIGPTIFTHGVPTHVHAKRARKHFKMDIVQQL